MALNFLKITDNILETDRGRQLYNIAVFMIGFTGIIYLFWKSIILDWNDVDFKYIWLSGHLWMQGISPYGPEFLEQGIAIFDNFNGQVFFYPPNFWFVSAFFAQFEYQTAFEIWRWTNLGLIIISSLLLRAAMRSLGINISWPYLVFYTGLVSLMQATVLTFILSQTSIVIYFGVCLFIYSILSKRSLLLALGLCVVLLKPQIGVGLIVALLPFKYYRKPVIITCFLILVTSLPALLPFGLIDPVISFLKNISVHGDFYANKAQVTTGLRNIIYHLSGIDLSSSTAALVSLLGVLVIIMFYKTKGLVISEEKSAQQHLFFIILSLSVVAALAPLHVYDFIFMAPVLLLCLKMDRLFQVIIFISFLLIARSDNISTQTGLFYSDNLHLWGSEISTFGAFCIAAVTCVAANRYLRKIKL